LSEPSTFDGSRRRSRREWAGPCLLFLVTTVVFVAPGMLPDRAMGAFDIWSYATPYRETTATQQPVNNPLQTDLMEQIPLLAEFWTSARAGDVQLWEPDQGAGVPLLLGVRNRVLAPPNLAFAVLSAFWGMTGAVALALFLSQLGAWAVARRLGVGPLGALLAGVAYGFSGPVTSLLMRIHETAMLPWVLLGVHGCFTASRRRRGFVLTVVATAGTVLSGFPAATLHVVYLAAVYGLGMTVLTWRRRGPGDAWVGAAGAAAAALAGGLLTAPILLPTAE
jgi:hypothetical protein